VTLIVDSGPFISAVDRRDPMAATIHRWLTRTREPVVTVAPVVSEVEHLLRVRFDERASMNFVADLGRGALAVECLQPGDYATVSMLYNRYRDLRPGLTDLSLIAVAERLQTTRILTFDQRHFRAMAPLQGGAFTLLPWDEPAP
jgi:uncharacterized protein